MKLILKKFFRPIYIFFLAIGFDPNKLLHLRYYPRYIAQYKNFLNSGGAITSRFTILSDYGKQAGSATGHYFHQDLLVASFIYENNPMRHIDVGSRIDGFVAHVASFRQINVMDVRDLKTIGHENINFIKADLTNKDISREYMADSISCLHAIEHFGLGRYGDPIDPNGHKIGFNNILKMLKPGGLLYISFPIANQNEVQFNAQRVFNPLDIFTWPTDTSRIKLIRFDYVDDNGDLHKNINVQTDKIDIKFGCGIYTFQKLI